MTTETQKKFHMCLNVRGFLMNATKREYRGMFKHDDGRPMTPDEAKAELLEALALGHEVIPLGKCDNFDFKGDGCQGHAEPSQKAEVAA